MTFGDSRPASRLGSAAADALEFESESAEQQDRYRVYAEVAEAVERALEDDRRLDVSEWTERHPHLADELRQLVQTLTQLHEAAPPRLDAAAPPSPASVPSALGDFQVIRQLGVGGMGVVYEARQISLERPVALKVLPYAGMLSQRRLQRFKNEAAAAASLHHPHIVPVFAVGCERNVHYFAMQLIDGCSLSDELVQLRAEEPLLNARLEPSCGKASGSNRARNDATTRVKGEATNRVSGKSESLDARGRDRVRDVASLAIDVARALHYAHERGIVHRDVKPSNLLRDADGKVWVADFGLAQIEADSDLTRTGDLLGTLRYMSPEQATGGAQLVDQRTDIYSLGVTLYELLTLRPAYPGDDRAELFRAVTSDVASPVPIQSLNPAVPVDLRTIVNKAIAKDPVDRYRTAEEMADDLQRFLDHRPIAARPAGLSERMAKWVRRHQSLAAMAFLFLLLATLILTATSLLVWREQSRTALALGRAERLARDKEALRQRAEDAARLASESAREERRQSELARTLLYVSDVNRADEAAREGDLPRLTQLLDRHLQKDDRHDVRGFEWGWLRRRLLRPGRALAERNAAVYCVRHSPDGRLLACAGADGCVYLYHVPSWRLVNAIHTSQQEVNSVAFSPDGSTLASAGDDGSVCLWSSTNGELVRRLHVSSQLVFGVAFTPDGNMLAVCGQDRTIGLWDPHTGSALGSLGSQGDGHVRAVEAIAMSPDGRQLASISGDFTARIWNIESRKCQWTLKTGTAKGNCLAYSDDGKWLATGNTDGTVLVWDVLKWSLVVRARHHDGVHALRFDASGKTLFAGDRGGVLRWWDVAPGNAVNGSGQQSRWYTTSGGRIRPLRDADLNNLAQDEASKEASSTRRRPESVPALIKAYPARPLAAWKGHEQRVYGLELEASEGALISVGADGRVVRWDRPAAQPLDQSWSHEKVIDFALFPDGDSVALVHWTGLVIASLRDGQVLRSLRVERFHPVSLAVSPDGRRAAMGCSDGRLRIVDSQSLEPVRDWLVLPKASVQGVSYSPDGERLLATAWTTSDNISDVREAWQFDVDSGAKVGEPLAPHSLLRYSPQSNLLAAKRLDTIHLLSADDGRHLSKLGVDEVVNSMAFSPDGRLLATGSGNRTIKLWNVAERRLVATLSNHVGTVASLCFSPDGRTLASGGDEHDRTLRLWNAATGQALFTLQTTTGRINKIAFSKDRRWLVYKLDNGLFHQLEIANPNEDQEPTP